MNKKEENINIAMRVISDHLRAVAFAIADGQLPSNVKAGYVIRRILRRAVRYYYSFLDMKEPMIYKLVDTLVKQMGDDYPELKRQQKLIENVIREEELSFLKTLEKGIKLLDNIIKKGDKVISGTDAFVLYDTYGFPLDLTELIAKENGISVDTEAFDSEMQKQKERARSAAEKETEDWTIINEGSTIFLGYDTYSCEIKINKYRAIKQNNKKYYHLVFDKTPFYSESGGQVGDTGIIKNINEEIAIENTIKEHNQIIHVSSKLPTNLEGSFEAIVDIEKQKSSARNHSATHLLHLGLRNILGTHVEQKGSLVDSSKLRFDFSHFNKLTEQEIREVELFVNSLIIKNIKREECREIPISEAKEKGAMMLFGEKYGDKVRLIEFGESKELCGGIHVVSTGEIGFFKIVSEGAIAAGIRRIEAVTGINSQVEIFNSFDTIKEISSILNNPKDILESINKINTENHELRKQIEVYHAEEIKEIKNSLLQKAEKKDNISIIVAEVKVNNANDIKEICSQIRAQLNDFAVCLAANIDGKAFLALAFSENLVSEKKFDAGKLIREIAKNIEGSGGGQAFIATAGGKNPNGIGKALEFAKDLFNKSL